MGNEQTRLDDWVETEGKDAAKHGCPNAYQDRFGTKDKKARTATCDRIEKRDTIDSGGLQA